MSQSGCKTTQMLKEFSCSPRELITSTEQTLLATGGKEKSERGGVTARFLSVSLPPLASVLLKPSALSAKGHVMLSITHHEWGSV